MASDAKPDAKRSRQGYHQMYGEPTPSKLEYCVDSSDPLADAQLLLHFERRRQLCEVSAQIRPL